jgi:hypothetical protein
MYNYMPVFCWNVFVVTELYLQMLVTSIYDDQNKIDELRSARNTNGKTWGKETIRRPRSRWKDNTKWWLIEHDLRV